MEDAALWRIAQAYGHIQRVDRQILLHTVADRPAHDAATVQIKDYRKVESTLGGPDIADVPRPFAKAAGRHLHDAADRLNLPDMPPFFNQREPRDFWLAKN